MSFSLVFWGWRAGIRYNDGRFEEIKSWNLVRMFYLALVLLGLVLVAELLRLKWDAGYLDNWLEQYENWWNRCIAPRLAPRESTGSRLEKGEGVVIKLPKQRQAFLQDLPTMSQITRDIEGT
jgi:hypothetical protein